METLEKIKDAEKKVEENILSTEEESKKLILNAKLEARKIIEEAQKEAEKIKNEMLEKAKVEIESEKKSIKEKWLQELSEIESKAKNNVPKAVESLLNAFLEAAKM
jgi:V/A-type H+-transporting ATPase subunit G/H